MRADELCVTPATRLAAMIRERTVSPLEVVDAFLEQIERVDTHVNAVCTPLPGQARDAARRAEAALAAGEDVGPLHGVPILFKDFTLTRGIRTTFGSRLYADHVPDRDAVLVERALAAGAIILGKTQTPEFALSGFTRNTLFGATRNPWALDRTPGGSSGGSAAAVAAAMSPIAEGSDAGGSIRAPASCTGIYGLKPQFGRIPFDGFGSRYGSLMTFGPLTRTVRDAALMLDVWAGPDPCDPWSLPDTGEDFLAAVDGDVSGLRVGYSPDFSYLVHPEVAARVDAAVAVLENVGCVVERVELDGWEESHWAWNTIWAVNVAGELGHLLPDHENELLDGTVGTIRAGWATTAQDLERAQRIRTDFYHSVERRLETYDVLVTPTLVIPPPSVDAFYRGPEVVNGRQIDPVSGWFFTCQFNLSGHPAASVPAGFTADGVPVGMQIVGRRFCESTVLRLSARYEEHAPWAGSLPPVAEPETPESGMQWRSPVPFTKKKEALYELIEIPEHFGPVEVLVDEPAVKAFAFAVDDYSPWYLGSESPFGGPIGHPLILGNELLFLFYEGYDGNTASGLHTHEGLTFLSPVRRGERVTVEGEYVDRYVKRGQGYVVLEAVARGEDGRELVRHRGIEIMRAHAGSIVGRRSAGEPSRRATGEVAEGIPPAASAHHELPHRAPIEPLTKHVTQDQMYVFSWGGRGYRNQHTDPARAAGTGVPRTVVQAQQQTSYVTEAMVRFFGPSWFTTGELDVRFISPASVDDDLTVGGAVLGTIETDRGPRLELEVWVDRQEGTRTLIGWASAAAPEQRADGEAVQLAGGRSET